MAPTSLLDLDEVATVVAQARSSRRGFEHVAAGVFPDTTAAATVLTLEYDPDRARVLLAVVGAVRARFDGRRTRPVEASWHAVQVPSGTTGAIADAGVALAAAAALVKAAADGLQDTATLPNLAELVSGDRSSMAELARVDVDQARELVDILASARDTLASATADRAAALYPCPRPRPEYEPLPCDPVGPRVCATTAVQSRVVRQLMRRLGADAEVSTETDRLGTKTTLVRWTDGPSQVQVRRLLGGVSTADSPSHRRHANATIEFRRDVSPRAATAAAVRFDRDHRRAADPQVTEDDARLQGYRDCQDAYTSGDEQLRRQVDLALRLGRSLRGTPAAIWAGHRQLLVDAAASDCGEAMVDTYTTLLDEGMAAEDAAGAAGRLATGRS